MSSCLRVLIDTRETDLWAALEPWWSERDGWIAERQTLDVGDIHFVFGASGEAEQQRTVLILERKTAADLGSSQRDGRYREQRARLLAQQGSGVKVGYLVEAPMPWSPTMSRTWCRGAFGELALATAIVRLQLRYGIPVFQTGELRETVMWLRRMAASLVGDGRVFETGVATTAAGAAAAYTEAIHVKKSANMEGGRLLVGMLRTIPGVGPAAAEAIVGHVGNSGFPALFALSESEIAAIRQGTKRAVGKAVAAKVWGTLHGVPAPAEEPIADKHDLTAS